MTLKFIQHIFLLSTLRNINKIGRILSHMITSWDKNQTERKHLPRP